MLRILSACTASVRTSLQGLDYFASDGSKAFEDLTQMTKSVSALGPGQEWEKSIQESLKAGKMYQKGDYKVIHLSQLLCAAYCMCIRTCTSARFSYNVCMLCARLRACANKCF